ncbi:hypothetical protein [Serratia fonticola]|uniref:hypothetical protein n=1 Tax=Serratia fonticola TaxID=47917 RepID=UPI002DC0201C|nr:hypothetical protein [Serratia fonticola]MEB7885388.1 hypothetical protein [Serratia fonticola]
MLSVASFTLFDVFILLVPIAAPFLLGVVILFILTRSFRHSGSRILLLWLVLPQISWSPSQLAHGFYTEEAGSHVVSALHEAGITCTQLRDALSNFNNGYTFENGKQRIEEVCGVQADRHVH